MINSIERRLGNLIILGQEPVANQNPVLVLMGRYGRGEGEGRGERGATRRDKTYQQMQPTIKHSLFALSWAPYVVCTVSSICIC